MNSLQLCRCSFCISAVVLLVIRAHSDASILLRSVSSVRDCIDTLGPTKEPIGPTNGTRVNGSLSHHLIDWFRVGLSGHGFTPRANRFSTDVHLLCCLLEISPLLQVATRLRIRDEIVVSIWRSQRPVFGDFMITVSFLYFDTPFLLL